jgi:HSP20 family molecular chaperone IbpA
VVEDKIAADYKNGVLRIVLPKAPEARRKEIKIQG